MSYFSGIMFPALFLGIGLGILWSTHKRWKWLVDPSTEDWLCYSQAFLKKVFGLRFLLIYSYALGLVFVALGILGIINGLRP